MQCYFLRFLWDSMTLFEQHQHIVNGNTYGSPAACPPVESHAAV
jgi:hypothetical protein